MAIGSRIGLIVLFCMGFFICHTTILRMTTLPLVLRSKEPSWEYAPTSLWSFVESATGVIYACLITLRQTIDVLWPKKWRACKSTGSGRTTHGGSDAPSRRGLGTSRLAGDETGNHSARAYHLTDMRSTNKGTRETNSSISPSESQEHIIGGTKTQTHATTDMSGSKSTSVSDDLELQGIKVTIDVDVHVVTS